MPTSKTSVQPRPSKPYTPGKNHFNIMSNGVKREFYLHVPSGYDATVAFPIVFMLHGHGGDGDDFYTRSGWKEVGEARNLFTVFPSSWHYDIIDDGVVKKNAKVWNKYDTEFCPGQIPCDDVQFFVHIIDEMKQRFNIADKQIYIVGFSNGACMSSRCAIELSDRIAGVVSASGSLPGTKQYVPKRLLPVLYQMGNEDSHQMEKLGITQPFPMSFKELYSKFPQIQDRTNIYINTFGLQKNYTVSGDPGNVLTATYKGLSGKSENTFEFWIIKGLGHAYPNGKTPKVMGAELHWQWLKKFKCP